MKLRPYQEEAVASIYHYFSTESGNPLIALPTGTGKSFVIAEFLRRTFATWPSQRILILTHVKELLQQNLEELLGIWPTAPAGIYSAGLKRRDLAQAIIFCGIASVASKADLFGHVDLVIVDECHLISHKADTMYQRFLMDLQGINSHLKVIGLSATPYRLGLGHLMEGGLFSDVCYDLTGMEDFNKLVRDGWLAPLVTKRTYQGLDITGVHVRGGEFVANELQAAVDIAGVTDAACHEMIHYGKERKHWLVFATGIEHAQHVADCLDYYGIPAKAVHSECRNDERDTMISDFKSGKLRCLVNNNILTTGFNFPGIDLIGFLRPTNSAVLWIQALGRGTRPCAGKENCLVLDFAGNTRRLGPINDPVLPRRKGEGGGGQAPVRVCEVCNSYNHAAARVCVECGAEFPREHRLATTAYTEEVMASSEPQIEPFPVDKVSYSVHEKPGRPPSLQVSYYCGLRLFREWVCFEHLGYPKKKAHDWWQQRSAEVPPETVKEAAELADSLPVPKEIKVWLNTKYPEVMDHVF